MDALSYILFVFIGIGFGILTGLTPGFHVNNVALIAIYLSLITSLDPFLLVNMLVATMITHTFVDFIPSTFLGAPNEDTSLSVLPMHRLLLKGEGYRAIYISSYASLLAVLFSLPLLPIFQIMLISLNLKEALESLTPIILFSIILGMFYMESRKGLKKMLYAILIFALSGAFGYLTFNFPLNGNILLFPGNYSLLFPVFTGLFGIPVLLLSQNVIIPPQNLERGRVKRRDYISSLIGTLSGSMVGFLPGVSSGVAAVLSRLVIKEDDGENFLFALGSVNTANYIFNLAALYILLKPRSGAVNSISQIYTVDRWYSLILIPQSFILILITVVISSILAFFITLQIGKIFAVNIEKLGRRYGHLSLSLIGIILLFVFLFTGTWGIVFVILATLIGVLPPKLGIMRTHLMGVIILPVLFFYL
ncbi:hypothetical protein B6U71_01185 [Euryarchaeota archaeon ex4484_178]|nr:MAG: hypothetical protein B6U71_01185 [Euryarchaeota archaeon ex4484_178]